MNGLYILLIICFASTLFCVVFQGWIKKHLEVLHLNLTSIGSVASLFIALFAYQIDVQVSRNTVAQARTNRSIAMKDSILNDEAIQALAQDVRKAEWLILTERRKQQQDCEQPDKACDDAVYSRKMLEIEQNIKMLVKGDDFPYKIFRLSQYVSQGVRCAGYRQGAESGDPGSPCDPGTLQALVGDFLHEVFVIVRPTLTCNPFFSATLEDFIEMESRYVRHAQEAEDRQQRGGERPSSEAPIATVRPSEGQTERQIYRAWEDVPVQERLRRPRVVEFGPPEFCESYCDQLESQAGSCDGLRLDDESRDGDAVSTRWNPNEGSR